MMKGSQFLLIARLAIVLFMGLPFALFATAGEQPWKRWLESEDYAAQNGSQAAFYEMGETASGGRIVNNDWGRDPGDTLRYQIETPHQGKPLFLTIRFARAMSSSAAVRVKLDDRSVDVRFPCTGGWGFREDQWRHGQIRFDDVPAGKHTIELTVSSPNSNLNTDGFYLSNHPVEGIGRTVLLEDEARQRQMHRQRQAELSKEARRLPPIAYVVQHRLGNPEGMVRYHAWPGRVVVQWGCRIEVLDPSQPEEPPRVIFDDPQGAIFDLNTSLDAETLFFSHRKKGDQNWHIWQIGVDGSGLKQITDGPYTDFGPEELADGRLVFCSTRIRSFNICAQTLSTALFTMNRDGNDMRQLTVNTLNDYSPHALPNGQILYTRWEYVDRDVKWRQSLWTVNPDGTNMQLYFGNTIRNPAVMWQARTMPGTDRVAATFAPHHGWPLGAIGTVTRRYGTETASGIGFDWITQEYPDIWDDARLTEWAYRDPFPISDRLLLVSYGGGLTSESTDRRFRIYLLDTADVQVVIHEDPVLSCICPVPIVKRSLPPATASRSIHAVAGDGVFLLQDVYEGLGNAVRPGEIKHLRIMEQPAKFPVNESSPRAFEMTPVMGRRCYYRKRCLGVVPVEKDGSAHFRVPALRELYFQALDTEGRAVQSMGSAVNLAPGEQQSCIGCHEHRTGTTQTRSRVPLAAQKTPVDPQPYAWAGDGDIDFPTVVQPVLDRHCLKCHSGKAPDGRIDLSGDRTRFFSVAYDGIWDRGLIWSVHLTRNDGQVIPPKQAWSFASGLTKYLEPEHFGVQLSQDDKHRVHLWLDTNGNYYGTHARTRPGTIGGRDCWTGDWFDRQLAPLYQKSCAECHGPLDKRRTMGNDKMVSINLSRPENSLLINAHLARSAGGLELSDDDPAKRPPIWTDTKEPVYRALLDAIRAGRQALLNKPRIDMPGAIPRAGHNDWGTYPGTVGADAPISEKTLPDETP